jgi:hypothetical protein
VSLKLKGYQSNCVIALYSPAQKVGEFSLFQGSIKDKPMPDELNIPDYILQVLARFGPMSLESDGWVFPCPCTTHGGKGVDRNPSLRVTIGDEGKIIVHCRTGCSTEEVLASVGLSYTDLRCPAGEEPATPLIFGRDNTNQEAKPLDLYSEVYSYILDHCVLHETHIEDLAKRGIDERTARSLGYKSLVTAYDQDILTRHLNRAFQHKLSKVPGFRPCSEKPNYYQFAIDPKGLIIPIRNHLDQVISLKTRRAFAPKYILWSTRGGPSAGTPVHCPYTPPSNIEVLRITEGEIKADVAWRKTGIYTVSIPGVNAWPSALPVIEDLKPKKVLLSFDYPDVLTKGGVARLLRLFAEDLNKKEYQIGLETWDTSDPNAKGIDDAVQLGLEPTVLWGEAALDKIRTIHGGSQQEALHFFTAGDPEPFPMESFPPILREFIFQHSQSIQCPEDFMATSVLAVAARCLGTSRCIDLGAGWKELPNQYYCIVAPPSSGKSPASKRVLAPIRRMQKTDALRYKDEKRNYQTDYRVWKVEDREARRAGEESPQEPHYPRSIIHYWVSDITVETVALRLHDNGDNIRHDPSLLYYRDEILAWIKSLNAYRGGKGGDREFFLSCWSNEDVKVDRKTDNETLIVSSPALTILGGIQPDLLNELSNDSGKDDGFFARLLFSFPNTTLGFDPTSSFVPDNDLEVAWETISRRLLSLSPEEVPGQSIDAISREYQPKPIMLSDEARLIWNRWQLQDNEIINNPKFPKNLVSAWGKHRAILARLALVMHYIHGASITEEDYDIDQPISAPAMQAAIAIMSYFRSHFQRVLKRIHYSPEERRLETFVKHVIDEHKGVISLRDVYRKRLFDCKGKDDAKRLCDLAVDRGYGILEKISGSTGRPSSVFIIQGGE